MPSRRQFIQAGLAMSVAPVTLQIGGPVAGPVPAPTSLEHPLYCLVCDVRSAWSTAVAREAERLGIRVARTSGDITDLWFDDLSKRWKVAPVAIGGVTEHGPLFCLERFGWDHGLRVVFRGTHKEVDANYVEHAIDGPFRTIAAAHTDLAGADWASGLARLLNSCTAALDTSSTTVRGARADDQRLDVPDALVSWVIAPKPAALSRLSSNVERS